MQELEHLSPERFTPTMQCALRYHVAGRLREAARRYQQAYEENPKDADTLLLLGILARQTHQHEAAIRLLSLAVTVRPKQAHCHLNLALAHLAASNLDAAESCCRKALELDPSCSAAWCCIGDVETARGHDKEAQEAWEKAIPCGPHSSRAELALGHLFCRQKKYKEALAMYRSSLRGTPADATSQYCLGAVLVKMGRREEAKAAYRKALELRSAFPEVLLNLGNLHNDDGEYMESAACYRQALALRPNYVKAWCNLGNALAMLGKSKEAAGCYQRTLQLDPGRISAQRSVGNLLLGRRDFRRAEGFFRKALEQDSRRPDLHNDLGNALYQQRRSDEAAACYRRAIELDPSYSIAHTNLANTLMRQGSKAAMIRHYQRGLELDPNSSGGHYNLALAYLRQGIYREGWREHEWRWDFHELRLRRRNFSQPQWAGEPLHGETILLHAEQGLGDTLQFVRYAPLVAERGGHVVLEVQPSLARLLRGMPGVNQIIAHGEPLPEFAYHCPLMSLPLAFDTALDTVPAQIPYIRINKTETDAAKQRYPGKGLRVGVAWAGNSQHRNDEQRSMPLAAVLPLAGVAGISWFGLQMGPEAEQMQPLAAQFPLVDTCSASRDFAETAGALSTLDLVISVDTSIAHLAGAMEIPVWVVLPWLADWRWMDDRPDCVWYPTARLFRQRVAGDWTTPVACMGDELKNMAGV